MSVEFSQAVSQIKRVGGVCDFLDSDAIKEAAERHVPRTMPPTVGGLNFDISLWMGLGVVGLWAALDAYAERTSMPERTCDVCGRKCLPANFTQNGKLTQRQVACVEDLEDLRNLFAHNFAGQTDPTYFERERHVLTEGINSALSSGAKFESGRVTMTVEHLRYYVNLSEEILNAMM